MYTCFWACGDNVDSGPFRMKLVNGHFYRPSIWLWLVSDPSFGLHDSSAVLVVLNSGFKRYQVFGNTLKRTDSA